MQEATLQEVRFALKKKHTGSWGDLATGVPDTVRASYMEGPYQSGIRGAWIGPSHRASFRSPYGQAQWVSQDGGWIRDNSLQDT